VSASPLEVISRASRAIVAAGALWREGLVPEAHTQMAIALRLALEPWAASDVNPAEPSADPTLSHSERGLSALTRAGYRNVGRLRDALTAVAGDPSSAPPHPPADFEWIWAEAERLCRFGKRRLATPLERKRTRARMGTAGALIALAIILAMVRVWGRAHVSASGIYDPAYPASYAFDDIDSTEWLLPDHAAGWLLISFSSTRHVHRVVLLNAHNRFYLDRGAERIRVTAFSKAGVVASAEGRFGRLTGDPSALELPLDAQDVSEIRVDVLSYYGNGGGLAEVEVH
jgi:hypothetical protein